MADGARLPEVFQFKDLVVRLFLAERAAGFARLPQSERRATPAIVRRLYKAAADAAAQDADCLICEAPAPVSSRVMIAVEKDGGHELGEVCAACARLGKLDAS
jgi:hypothetical protein